MSGAAGRRLAGSAGHYLLEEERASGGFGTTYLARREEDGRAVLVKVLRLDRMKEWKALELFRREAEVLRHLSHPGIPAYLDEIVLGTSEAPEGFALVEELVPGTDLAQLMRSGARADRARLLDWLDQLLRVLVYLHQQAPPVIHRDISPKNIVLRPDGRVALVDFGSVQAALRREESVASTAAGTFGFAPMEQFVGRATAASDLYALGMTFLSLATGLPPEQMPVDGIRVNVRALLGGDARLIRLLEAMTAPDPRERLADAGAARRALTAIRSGDDRGAAVETRQAMRGRRLGSVRRIALLAGTLAVALFAALEAYFFFIGPTGTYFLVYAADPGTGSIAFKSYFRAGSVQRGDLKVRDGGGGPPRGRSLPTNAYLCGLSSGVLTYFTRGAGSTTFWQAPATGGPAVELLRAPLSNQWESCGLHAGRLAIESDDPPEGVRVLLQDGSDRKPAPGTAAGDHHPAWFPDGDRLVVSSHDGARDTLVAIDLSTGQREPLTSAAGPQHQDIRPAVSPDGKRVAFYRSSRQIYGDLANRQTSASFDLQVLDLSSKEVRLLLQDVCFATAPQWAGPELLAFGKWTDRHCGLYVYDLAADQQRLVDNDY